MTADEARAVLDKLRRGHGFEESAYAAGTRTSYAWSADEARVIVTTRDAYDPDATQTVKWTEEDLFRELGRYEWRELAEWARR